MATHSDKNIYCVYYHINSVKNEIFYVGIGTQKRAFSKNKRSFFWQNVVNKYNYIVDIIAENLLWDEACEIEKKNIAKIGRRDKGLGPLVNMTDGGDGAQGVIRSEESKKKYSLANKGKQFRLGIKSSPEACKRISEGHLGIKLSEESKKKLSESLKKTFAIRGGTQTGKKATQETKAKMSLSHTGQKFSEETKLKLKIKRNQRKPISEETRRKMSDAKKGKKLSEEHKANIKKNHIKSL